MRFSTSIVALALAACTSALPTSSRNGNEIVTREAGPSGYLLSPNGGTRYLEGDKIDFVYRRVIGKSEQTDSVDVVLKTTDGANEIMFASYLSFPGSLGSDTINGTFTIPKLAGRENQLEWEARLEVTERQVGNRNAAPFLAQAPQLWINPKLDGPISPN